MKSVPGRSQVDRALKAASREVKSATRRVNQQAGKLMARGNYEGAQAFLELGRAIRDFQSQVDELRTRWKAIRADAPGTALEKAETTPIWKLYSPALRTLLANGGSMAWKAIEGSLESDPDFHPLPGDQQIVRGKQRWVHSLHRARAGMVKEGFIEKRGNFEWRITPAGRKAAESGALEQD